VGQQAPKRKYVRHKCRIISDKDIVLTGANTQGKYSRTLRLVTAEVEIKGRMVEMKFIANSMEWSPYTICQLYQCRWGVEVFFKEIKQTLQLSDFLGCSENAVKWQVWMALLAYLLLRFTSWLNGWRHQFIRFFTLVRAVLWNFFRLDAVVKACDAPKPKRHIIRGSPSTAYQPCFPGFE